MMNLDETRWLIEPHMIQTTLHEPDFELVMV